MRASQVRLEPDVVALLRTDPDVDGLSLSAASNRALRSHYGPNRTSAVLVAAALDPDHATTTQPEPGNVAEASTAPLPAPGVVRGPGGSRGACRRCGKRRAVGDRCGWCGTPL